MRILTVRQPWAWAIIHGGKDVENRSRSLGPYRGPVAIHAGKEFDNSAWTHPPFAEALMDEKVPSLRRLGRGAIIGVVDLVDVHWSGLGDCDDGHDERETFCSVWAQVDDCHLILANPRPLKLPIPHKGGLGLRHVDPDLEAAIWEQVQR